MLDILKPLPEPLSIYKRNNGHLTVRHDFGGNGTVSARYEVIGDEPDQIVVRGTGGCQIVISRCLIQSSSSS
ncbi:MAG: hypothetical protein WCV93_04245 [Candidatus Shapirobacteria bacterium]|jgi:hypothetical protein